MMIDWHVTTLSLCSKKVWAQVLGDKFEDYFGILVTPVKLFPRDIHIALKMVNNDWLPRGLLGGKDLNLGDILTFHELITLNMSDHDFKKYPEVVKYMKDLIQRDPCFSEGLKSIKRMTEANKYEWMLPEAKL